jgi:16S rRNA (cytidine1402-2'-O)-methyltransferase
MPGKLYLIPNIIHPNTENEVIAPLIFSVIKKLDYYFVENERTARRYLSSLMKLLPVKERTPIELLEFEKLDKNTSEEEVSSLLQPVRLGRNCGILSESGCPGIADPGSLAAMAAHRMKIELIPLPGPSSIFMALMASGMNGQTFAFHGYLPIEKQQLVSKIKQLENSAKNLSQTQIFIETPYRNKKMFDALTSTCNNRTSLCLAVEITSQNAFIKTQTIGEWKSNKMSLEKVPVVFLLSAQ